MCIMVTDSDSRSRGAGVVQVGIRLASIHAVGGRHGISCLSRRAKAQCVSIWFSLPAVDTGRCGAGPRWFFCPISVGESWQFQRLRISRALAPVPSLLQARVISRLPGAWRKIPLGAPSLFPDAPSLIQKATVAHKAGPGLEFHHHLHHHLVVKCRSRCSHSLCE